ncbi:MAG: hypothetical protein AAB383_05055 [Patescibacteria group bacterium]
MNKLFSLFLATLLLTACSSETPAPGPIVEEPTVEPVETLTNDDWTDCSLAEVQREVEEQLPEKLNPNQITACQKGGDMSYAFVSQPNSWNALQEVRDWEGEGNSAWAGLLSKEEGSEWEVFFTIPDEDFNPVNLFITEESLVLDIVDDSGAGSGEGKLLRYVNFGKWVKEKCDEYYIPETYSADKTCQ